jgi:hypothetical protein
VEPKVEPEVEPEVDPRDIAPTALATSCDYFKDKNTCNAAGQITGSTLASCKHCKWDGYCKSYASSMDCTEAGKILKPNTRKNTGKKCGAYKDEEQCNAAIQPSTVAGIGLECEYFMNMCGPVGQFYKI